MFRWALSNAYGIVVVQNKYRAGKPEGATMQVVMIRKASSKAGWYDSVKQIRALFDREPGRVEAMVAKEVIVTDAELKEFENNFFADSKIIKANQELMKVDENEVWHCLKITSKKADYSILVNSDGYDYARYTAIIKK